MTSGSAWTLLDSGICVTLIASFLPKMSMGSWGAATAGSTAANRLYDLDRVVFPQLGRFVLAAWHDRPIQLHRNPFALQAELHEQGAHADAGLDRLVEAIDGDRDHFAIVATRSMAQQGQHSGHAGDEPLATRPSAIACGPLPT